MESGLPHYIFFALIQLCNPDPIPLWGNALGLFENREQQPDMRQALRLALAHDISAYDAQYVALAESLGAVLVMEDRRLQRLFSEQAVSLAAAAESAEPSE